MTSDLGYYRHPAIHGDSVVFVCESDLWSVPATGGVARRLTATSGSISFPRFSPDGSQIAFTNHDEGPFEVYLMEAEGGHPRRLTWFGVHSIVAGWDERGKAVITASDWRQPFAKTPHLVAIPTDGSEPKPLGSGPARAFSREPGGKRMVVGRNSGDPARWKRYRGGTAGTLWIDRTGKGDYAPLVKLDGNLANPMWIGNRIYFLSDHEGYGNIYSCAASGRGLKRHTDHEEFYARFPASDGERIVYHAGADLYVFDPASNETRKLDIQILSSRTLTKRKFVAGSRGLESVDLHPKGHSLAAISRGGIFTMGLWEGAVRRYGKVSEVRYRLGRWLPDGKRMVAVQDEGNGEDLIVFSTAGQTNGESVVQRVSGDFGRATNLLVQPHHEKENGATAQKTAKKKTSTKKKRHQHIAIVNQRHELILVDLDARKGSETKVIAHTRFGESINGAAWSPDGKWIAYGLPMSNRTSAIFLYNLDSGESTQVTQTDFIDGNPSFDPGGKFLYFISARVFNPIYDGHYFDLGFPKGTRPYLIPLEKSTLSPFLPAHRSLRAPTSNGDWNEHKRDGETARETKIDLDGIQDRVLSFPVEEGRYDRIVGAHGRAFFLSFPVQGSLGDHWSEDEQAPAGILEAYDFERNKTERVANRVSGFSLSLDYRTLVIRSGRKVRVVATRFKDAPRRGPEGQTRESGWIDIDRIRVAVVPRKEWHQMFDEAWRLQRDQFWTSDMSGIDWDAVRETYRPLVDRVSTRAEFSDLIWELQGELGTSHCYEMGGDYQPSPSYHQGFVGADLAFDRKSERWKIDRIPQGDSWDPVYASPAAAPGVNLTKGDEILAIGGEPVDKTTTPYERLVNLAGQAVELTIQGKGNGTKPKKGDKKTAAEAPRTVVLQTLRSEASLRYRDWVETNRARVHKESKGRVGYIHVPNMGPFGYSEFHRYFMMEAERDGLIIDVRFNGGGHVSQILLEKLLRKRIGYDVNRWGEPDSYPLDAPAGPIVALTNEYAGSDGDMFSHAFKLTGIGPLIGKRTWGGVVGIWPRHSLVDGAVTTQPEFAFWFEDVGWGIENYGTDPDIEVEIRPQDYAKGIDPQLNRGLAEVGRLLKKSPPTKPKFKDRPKLRPKKLPARK